MDTAAGTIRAFYAALGVDLPTWAGSNAAVRCFADPEAHEHADRTPSCSVSMESGAWRCWGCGARGGAYDAALALGHTARSAIDLMVATGLVERRAVVVLHPSRPRVQSAKRSIAAPAGTGLAVTDSDVSRWHQALLSDASQMIRGLLQRERQWSAAAIHELELGHDGSRITIPIRNADGDLRGVLRYRQLGRGPKMLAVRGTRLGLIPHPSRVESQRVLLVEGPPDMIAARSCGWPAIAIPGDHAWRPGWAELLSGRAVTVLMDCDTAGRSAAGRIAADLQSVAAVRVVDLAPERTDGFDLTDWLRERSNQRRSTCGTSSSSRRTIKR
jgi:hypothetical protein